MQPGQPEQPLWKLPAVGPEVAPRLQAADASGATSASAGAVSAWLCAQEKLQQQTQRGPLVTFTLDDCTLLEKQYRSAALWDRLIEARSLGELTQLRLSLDKVKPRPVPASWFELAAEAGVVEIALDVAAVRVDLLFSALTDLCAQAKAAKITPRVLLPLAGPGIDLAESATRAVVLLKRVLPWQPVPAELSAELRRELSAPLAAAVERGTSDAALLGDLVLGPWFHYLPPANRRALFPVWLAANPQGQEKGSCPGREESLAGLHSQLKPAFSEWLQARAPLPA